MQIYVQILTKDRTKMKFIYTAEIYSQKLYDEAYLYQHLTANY